MEVKTCVTERYDELRDIGGWARAWFANPIKFAVSFLAAAAEHDNDVTGESGPGPDAG